MVKAFSFSLFFFFFNNFRRFGLGQISKSVKSVSGGWRHQLRHSAGGHVWLGEVACETEAVNADVARGAWKCVA